MKRAVDFVLSVMLVAFLAALVLTVTACPEDDVVCIFRGK